MNPNTRLARITFTGADDTVSPGDLLAISRATAERAPGFDIEWGILIGSQHGHRFPSEAWILRLIEQFGSQLNLSLHICGGHLRFITEGLPLRIPANVLSAFDRCQLNFHAKPQGDIAANIMQAFQAMPHWTPEVIFQLDGVNNELARASGLKRVAGLFDLSHGAGVLPDEWPKTGPFADFPLGYAGGLGPENVSEELPKIHAAAAGPYWIDMETKLFRGLQFSPGYCLDVIDCAANFVKGLAA